MAGKHSFLSVAGGEGRMSAEPVGSALRLKDLGASEYSRLSELLDLCIELDPAARQQWLAGLESEDPRLSALLRKLFAPPDTSQSQGLLETRDVLARHLESLLQVPEALAGKRVGPYRVLSLLGQGGMGSVWLAERADGLFARRVALKLVHPALMGRGATERFAREREILASLSHPNIARLFDAGFAEDGQPYLALQYVAGTPITTYCDRARIEINQRLQLFLQVLSAMEYAHANLVIHRDLKPSNILVNENGEVQLLDFGIAKLLTEGEAKETELTQIGGRALTPDYAAPEQIAGAPLTTAADVYALGVVLYELLTGERPYRLKRDSRGALEEAILLADPVAPSGATLSEVAADARATTTKKLARALNGDLDTIAIKALKKPPTERYATANAFGEDIARFLRGDVVLAQPDSLAYRALKFARRHRVAIAATCILILTLAGGLAATAYEAAIASEQRDDALQAHLRLLTQTAASRLKDADVPGALSIVLEVLPHPGGQQSYTPEALSVFQEARAADIQVLAITGHTDRVRSVAFSPDGRRLITASYDKTARVWDAATGQPILLLSGHTDRVTSAAFSPDGRRLITSSVDKTVRVWDAASGQQILLLTGHTDRVTSAVFSPDGKRILTASYDKTARIWDAVSGQQTLLLSGHAGVVASAVFSPDGRRILTASHDKTACIWDATNGQQILLLTGHTDRLTSAAFSPDGQRVVTSSYDKTARVWDALAPRQIALLRGHTELVVSAAFSPDGQRVVTGSLDKTVRIWDAATGQQAQLLSGHTDEVNAAVFSPDGQRVATASVDKTARVWNAVSGQQVLLLNGHTDQVPSAAFSSDGRRVVTASSDKSARIWDAETGRQMFLLTCHTYRVWTADFSPDGQRVVTASYDKSVRIWDATTGRQMMLLSGHKDPVTSAAFSPDGRRVVSTSVDRSTRIWDATTGQQIMQLNGHMDRVWLAAFSSDGRRVVTASADKTARIWNAATGQQMVMLSGHTEMVTSAAFSFDGRHVVTTSYDKTARIWDAATGQQLVVLGGHADYVESAAFSPDDRRVVTGSGDNTARIWAAATGQQILLLSGHTDRVTSASFSPDGRNAITASDDGTARIWDTRAPALDIQVRWANTAQFDPLTSTERFRLGLPAPTDVRQWAAVRSKCDESAAAPHDPDRRAPGVMLEQIVADIAVDACANKKSGADNTGRSVYQHGRALMASGHFSAARRDFEEALADGYRVARFDLGMLLAKPSGGMIDVRKAISLYEQAWNDGVTIAAFGLGSLYEHGMSRDGQKSEYLLAPDSARAWFWYRKGADLGEPNALARFAEEEGRAAFSEETPATKNSHLLESFKYYAVAAERARSEDWPDDAWRNWRYRRASLARLLARDGMMQNVADVFVGALEQYRPRPPTIVDRLTSFVRME